MDASDATLTALPRPTPVWLDCDTGHDDAFAILLAARSPRCHLLGVSTVYGNAPLPKTTYNTRAILQAIGRSDVPVYPGASEPLESEAIHAPDIHGESGLDGTTCLPEPTVPERDDQSAVEAMYAALMAQPAGSAHLVAVGALTNVAALITARPDIVEHLGGLSIMGGAIGGGFTSAPMGTIKGQGERFGNYTPYAEFNIYIDAEAAQIIFSNVALAAKTTLVTLDLTHQFLATSDVLYGMLFGFDGPVHSEATTQYVSTLRRLFYEILTFFKKTYADVFGLTTGAPLHDPLAVAAAIAPQLFYSNRDGAADADQGERFHVQVITEGTPGSSDPAVNTMATSQRGRTIASPTNPGEPGVRIPRGLAVHELWNMLESCLSSTETAMREAVAAASTANVEPT